MKSIKLFSALCALLAVVAACEQPYDGPDNPSEGGTRLTVAMEGSSTKVNVNDLTGACTWATGTVKDKIAVWFDGTSQDGSVSNRYVSYDVTVESSSNPEEQRTGGVTLNIDGTLKRGNFAVFPAASAVQDWHVASDLRVLYPTTYNLADVAESELLTYSQMPMVASNDPLKNRSLMFYHVGGLLRIELSSSEIVGASQVRVTFLGMDNVTGTYKVGGLVNGEVTGSVYTEVSSPETGTGNVVTFTIPTVGSSGKTWVNVPLPAGNYSSLKGVQVDVSGGGVNKSQVKAAPWHSIVRRQGKRLSFGFDGPGALSYIDIPVDERVTMWKGQSIDVSASAFDDGGTLVPNAAIIWSVEPATGVAEIVGGKLVAVGAGEALVKAASTQYPEKFDTFSVYVNEATIALNPGELTGRAGKSGKITADVTYTRNGDWSVPVVSWTSGNSTVVALKDSATLPGESNAVTFGSAPGATTTITAEILAGTDIVATASCNTSIISAAYVPGKFSVSPTKKVWFASGNLLFKADKNGDNWTNRRWEFAQNQWDYYAVDAKESWNQGDGTDKVIDLFAWASNGVQNPYDASQKCYEPFDRRTDALNFPDVCWVWWREYDMYDYPEAEPEYNILPTWLKTGGFGPLANDNGLGITISSSEVERIQNFGGECQPEEYEAWRVFVNDLNFKDALINSSDNYDYGWNAHDDVKKYCEWGLHLNADGSENTNTPLAGTWYTLSKNEWEYLYFSRPKAALLRSAATIYDSDGERFVNGMILLPDNWEIPESCTFTPIINDGNPLNIYIAGTGATNGFVLNGRWEDMEAAGAVFIPELVYKRASSSTVLREWRYWTSTACLGDAFSLIVTMDSYWLAREINTRDDERNSRLPVRLVHD